MISNVRGCARCGGDHPKLEFKKFKNPCIERTHWALCPTTGEPILMRITDWKKIPRGDAYTKGAWMGVHQSGLRTAIVTCPECSKQQSLINHFIDHHGKVNPSFECRFCDCSEFLQLEGWDPQDSDSEHGPTKYVP
jgi:hypothetical protein